MSRGLENSERDTEQFDKSFGKERLWSGGLWVDGAQRLYKDASNTSVSILAVGMLPTQFHAPEC